MDFPLPLDFKMQRAFLDQHPTRLGEDTLTPAEAAAWAKIQEGIINDNMHYEEPLFPIYRCSPQVDDGNISEWQEHHDDDPSQNSEGVCLPSVDVTSGQHLHLERPDSLSFSYSDNIPDADDIDTVSSGTLSPASEDQQERLPRTPTTPSLPITRASHTDSASRPLSSGCCTRTEKHSRRPEGRQLSPKAKAKMAQPAPNPRDLHITRELLASCEDPTLGLRLFKLAMGFKPARDGTDWARMKALLPQVEVSVRRCHTYANYKLREFDDEVAHYKEISRSNANVTDSRWLKDDGIFILTLILSVYDDAGVPARLGIPQTPPFFSNRSASVDSTHEVVLSDDRKHLYLRWPLFSEILNDDIDVGEEEGPLNGQ